MYRLDLVLFSTLHGITGQYPLVDFLVVFFGEYYFYALLLIFAYHLYREYRKGGYADRYIVALAAAVFARIGVVELIRVFYHRPRPFVALQVSHLLNDSAYSFPSGHTIFMFALATVTYFFNKKLARFLYISGFLIGIARVAGGVHYPSDVVGGIALGMTTGYIVYIIWERYRGRTIHRIMSV